MKMSSNCDTCGAKPEGATVWPTCRACSAHTCPSDMEPGTLLPDHTCLCKSCLKNEIDQAAQFLISELLHEAKWSRMN